MSTATLAWPIGGRTHRLPMDSPPVDARLESLPKSTLRAGLAVAGARTLHPTEVNPQSPAWCSPVCGTPPLSCTLGHFMLPILHFRPHYGSNGRSGGVLECQFLAGDLVLPATLWFQPRPDYGSSNKVARGFFASPAGACRAPLAIAPSLTRSGPASRPLPNQYPCDQPGLRYTTPYRQTSGCPPHLDVCPVFLGKAKALGSREWAPGIREPGMAIGASVPSPAARSRSPALLPAPYSAMLLIALPSLPISSSVL